VLPDYHIRERKIVDRFRSRQMDSLAKIQAQMEELVRKRDLLVQQHGPAREQELLETMNGIDLAIEEIREGANRRVKVKEIEREKVEKEYFELLKLRFPIVYGIRAYRGGYREHLVYYLTSSKEEAIEMAKPNPYSSWWYEVKEVPTAQLDVRDLKKINRKPKEFPYDDDR